MFAYSEESAITVNHLSTKHPVWLLSEDTPVSRHPVIALQDLLSVGETHQELGPPAGLLIVTPVDQLLIITQLMILQSLLKNLNAVTVLHKNIRIL